MRFRIQEVAEDLFFVEDRQTGEYISSHRNWPDAVKATVQAIVKSKELENAKLAR